MKKAFIALFLLSMFVSGVFSQSADLIRQEANTDYVYTPDNSEYARLWQQQVDAKKRGDQQTHDAIARELSQKYPDKVLPSSNYNPFRIINHQQPPFTPDVWGGDVTLYASTMGGTSPGNPTPFNRNIRLDADSLGNQYAAFLAGNRDTLVVMKSTNQGLNWTRIFSVLGVSTGNIHSFDMHITDSANTFRLGFAISLAAFDGGSGYAATMYWLSLDQNGNAISVTPLSLPAVNRGYIGPAIISDGWSWSAGLTYWYMTFQNVDTTTGVGTQALLAWSTNWGRTWLLDTARNSFNDYELDIDYNFAADSIYVSLTNNLTVTNENLRLMYSALGNLGTGVAFKQVNTAGLADHDRMSTIAVNRTTNEMTVMYTKYTGSNADIRVSYSPDGTGPVGRWTLDQTISGQANNEINATIKGQDRQGAYRISYVSQGTGFDTVIYSSSFTPTGFGTRQRVNDLSANSTAPAVVGYRDAGGFNGGVLYSSSTDRLMYDGAPLNLTAVDPIGNNIPGTFSLEQNYPNPFNPATTIKFSVPKTGFITLKIYDMVGREVASLVNNNINAGTYKADFDASMLGSGVYFYKLVGDGFTDTKKMILVK